MIKSPFSNLRKLRKLTKFEDNPSKKPNSPLQAPSSMPHAPSPLPSSQSDDIIWALRDVSFEVKRGEVVGIIGRNGAGKTTLLKIISRITEPTSGKVTFNGRVSSLLEVGTGFHPELTGRENVYLNGTILGMSKTEVDRKFDEIVAFSEVEKFLDTPVKRYSSGMQVRLAFAVAAHLEPEIMLVDEVLAVGDIRFQEKCLGKMKETSLSGRTVLFVSHNMNSIRQLCSKCIWIDEGRIKQTGPSISVLDSYINTCCMARKSELTSECKIAEDREKEFQLRGVRILSEEGVLKSNFNCDEPIIINMLCQVHKKLPGLYGYMTINREGTKIVEVDSFDMGNSPLDNLSEGFYEINISIPPRTLGPGDYQISLSFASEFSSKNFIVHDPGRVCSFHLDDFRTRRGNSRNGFFSTLLTWDIKPVTL